ncbi:MAG: HlyD family efflux transporter periplasmic adaptor subunit [Planctomycetes bacterium]|nr:HlyD family efflux transporter periplasmic adaptor subunit [Planctomycetota bacterium]
MKKSKIKNVFILIILIAVGGAVGYALYTQKFKANDGSQELSLFTVERGPLTISVLEAGTINARDVEVIKSEVEGFTTVLWVIEEATKVKKGDMLIELDASKLNDSKDKQEITLQNSHTAFIISKETLEVAKNKAKSDVEQADLTHTFAKMDLEKYLEGEYPTQLKDSRDKIEIAEDEVKRTLEKYEGSQELKKDEYISETELKSDEISWKKARLDLTLQKSQLDLLIKHTHPRTLAELKSNVKQADMALERTKRKADADIFEADAKLKSADAKYKSEQGILDKIVQQISKTVIYAPNDGRIIYASSTRASWRSSDEPLSEGESVREREELFHLPKGDLVSVVANVHEANLDKVKIGSPVSIKVDAVPGEVFSGVVGKIAIMPDARMVYINPNLKVYKTEMFLDDKIGNANGRLRTGMGCQAEVVTAHYEDAIYVPIQAVITVGDQPTVYVYENGKTKPRDVAIGEDNNRMIRIISGLKKGEQVLMTPPLSKAEVKGNGKGRPRQGSKPDGMGRPGQGSRPGGTGRPQGGGGAGRQGGGGRGSGGGGRNRPGGGGGKGPENK